MVHRDQVKCEGRCRSIRLSDYPTIRLSDYPTIRLPLPPPPPTLHRAGSSTSHLVINPLNHTFFSHHPHHPSTNQAAMDSIPGLELFNSYEQEFNDLVISIRNAINVEAKNSAGEPRKAVLRRAERDLEEAEEIISQMDVELQSLDRALKPTISQKLKSFRAELSTFKLQIKQAHSQSALGEQTGTAAYAAQDESSVTSKTQAQRERLLQANYLLESGSSRLESSHRIALETEELGTGILRDLRGQREQIEGTRDTLREADGHIDKASNTLNKMIRRMNRQRLITGAIIAVLVLLILFILYSKLR